MILEDTNSIALIACFLTTNQQQRYLQSIFRKILLCRVTVELSHVIKYGALFNFGKGIITAIFGLRLTII